MNGELHIGSVYFDSTYYYPARNKIFCAAGGKVYLGGSGKTISGRLNLHVEDGGHAVILEGTTLILADTSEFLVEGELTFESCTISSGCHIRARENGTVVFDTAATVTGLKNVLLADNNTTLTFSDSCIIKMEKGGQIEAHGTVNTPNSGGDGASWCRIQSRYATSTQRCTKGDEWKGLLLYGNWNETTIQNTFIHHGYPGLWIYSGNPEIKDCEISYNYTGCRITEGNPHIHDNRFEENGYIGLEVQTFEYPAIEDNIISDNVQWGVFCYASESAWYNNRIDSNKVGVEVTEYSDIFFNEWDGEVASTMCDTTDGNGVRNNWAGGITVRQYSSIELHCDNSVYENHVSPLYGNDIGVNANGRAVGWGNYPDSTQTTPDSLVFANSGIFQWSDPTDSIPSPLSDPVLAKAGTRSAFANALDRAQAYTKQGLYTMAQADYALALTESKAIPEMLLAAFYWRRMVQLTEKDSALYGKKRYISPNRSTYANALSANATYADSTWKREIAAELLSLDQIKRRDTSAARTNLQNLASNGSSLALKRRALLRLVYLDRCIGHDYATAFARYQTLENSYANTRESVYAKLLLCLHPDSTEWSAFAKETESDSFVGTVHPAIPGWITLSPVWPNPFKDRTTLHVQTEEEQFVDLLIYDISGKVLRREPGYLLRAGKNSLTVERDALSSGLYIIVVQSGAKRVSSLIQVGDW